MNKSLIALATAAVAITATVSQAEAGHGFHIGFGFGGPPIFNSYGNGGGSPHCNRHVYRAERVQSARAARKAQPTEDVAKTEDKPADETVAQNENSSITIAADKAASIENSSITVASTEPVKITETKKTAEAAKAIAPVKTAETKKNEPAVAQKLDCKKFFPSVGLTLTVPCE